VFVEVLAASFRYNWLAVSITTGILNVLFTLDITRLVTASVAVCVENVIVDVALAFDKVKSEFDCVNLVNVDDPN
jgi:hypothetical protein